MKIYFHEFLRRLQEAGVPLTKVIFRGDHLMRTYRIRGVSEGLLLCLANRSKSANARFYWDPSYGYRSPEGHMNFAKLEVEGLSQGEPGAGLRGARALIVSLRKP